MHELSRIDAIERDDKPIFALLHGSWHGAWCWEDLRDELLQKGYESIAVDFQNDVPGATFDVHSEDALYQIESDAKGREIILVAHSRAANIAPRLAGSVALKHIVYLCGSFEPATLLPLSDNKPIDILPPRKYSDELQRAFTSDEWGMSEFGHKEAVHFFFHDCPEEIQDYAPSRLRPQYKTSHEPPLDNWPDLAQTPQTYIRADDDRVISPSWSAYIAEHILQIPMITIESGHSPFYSQPAKLAALLINITMDNNSTNQLVGTSNNT